jgi:hypothetical protein
MKMNKQDEGANKMAFADHRYEYRWDQAYYRANRFDSTLEGIAQSPAEVDRIYVSGHGVTKSGIFHFINQSI